MNDEIKEVLDNLKFNVYETKNWITPLSLNQKTWKILLDYITNLQQDLEKANDIIVKDREFYKSRMDEYVELKKENESNINRIHELEQEIDRLNNVIEIMEKYFELIIDLGYDYDGLNYEQDLKGLIDDILRFAKLGRVYNTTETIFVDRNKKYNILNEELKEDK